MKDPASRASPPAGVPRTREDGVVHTGTRAYGSTNSRFCKAQQLIPQGFALASPWSETLPCLTLLVSLRFSPNANSSDKPPLVARFKDVPSASYPHVCTYTGMYVHLHTQLCTHTQAHVHSHTHASTHSRTPQHSKMIRRQGSATMLSWFTSCLCHVTLGR